MRRTRRWKRSGRRRITPAKEEDDNDKNVVRCIVAWVTRSEHSKGAKDEVKDARRAKSWPEGPPTRSRGPMGPRLLVFNIAT